MFCRILCAGNIPPNGNVMPSIPPSIILLDIIELLTDCCGGIREMTLAFPRRIAYRKLQMLGVRDATQRPGSLHSTGHASSRINGAGLGQ